MRKLLAVIAIALVVAAAVWVGMKIQLAHRLATVAELLPKTTLLVVHAPDLKRTREQWHESDLYQIWRQPGVQSLLDKPLGRLGTQNEGRQALEEFLQLGPTHAFVALTSLEKNEPKLVGGFHYAASIAKAKEFMKRRESKWWPKASESTRTTLVYQQHDIETINISHLIFASVYDEHWFLASNDIEALKAVLDRADRRDGNKADGALKDNETFVAAKKHLPTEYAALLYLDPRPFVEKLMLLISMTGQSLSDTQLERLRSIRSISGAIGFEKGKMRETDFVAMPRVGTEGALARPLLAASDANTFFYSGTRLNWPEHAGSATAPPGTGLSTLLQQFDSAMTARGLSADDVRRAFGEELEITGEWPVEVRWPSFLATIPISDSGRARKIADALTSVEIAGTPWTRTERNGLILYNAQPFGAFIPVNVTMGVSDKTMFLGSDANLVEKSATTTAQPSHALETSNQFQQAAGQVPAGETAFNYVDTRLLYQRLDATLRPLLLMGATIYPALGKKVDLSKLPPADAIAKHLSPIVMAQRYETDGYVTESVGLVTFREATLGVAGAVGASFFYLREGLTNMFPGTTPMGGAPSPAASTPSPTAAPSPF